jgi:hypothetical protein
VVVKGLLGSAVPSKSQGLGSSNLYAILTIAATLMLLPGAALFEGSKVRSRHTTGHGQGGDRGRTSLMSDCRGAIREPAGLS